MALRPAPAVLAAAWGLGLATALVFWSQDTVPPRWDAAGHLLHCLEYRDLLSAGRVRAFLWGQYAYYPPLVYQVTAVLHLLLGASPWVPWAVMQVFALGLGLATWRLGRAVGGPSVAALAGAMVLLLPIVVVFTREFALDVPLTAAATALLWLVIDDPLRSPRSTLALGVVTGLGLLAKWSFALAAVGPLAYLAVAAARGRVSRGRFAAAMAVAAALALPWYATHLRRLWADSWHHAVVVAAREGDPPPASLGSLTSYAWTAFNEWFFLPLGAVVAWGVVAAVRRGGPALLLLNLAVWPTYLLFTAIPNKDPRYALSMVPALCIAAAQAIATLSRSAWRWIAGGAVLTLLTLQHVAGVVELGPLSARANVCVPGPGLTLYDPADPPQYFRFRARVGWPPCRAEWTLYNPFSYFGRPPRQEDWRVDAMVAAIPAGAPVRLPADDVHLNPALLQYAARRAGRPIRWAEPGEAGVTLSRETVPAAAEPATPPPCRSFPQPDGTRVVVCPP